MTHPETVAGPLARLLRVSTMAAVVSTGTLCAQESQPSMVELELESVVFQNTRTIRVLLPPGYTRPQNQQRRYPVFYFTDGVAAFDAGGWNVPGVVDSLWRKGVIPPCIVVGVDNGGSTKETTNPVVDRASEYLPYDDPTWTTTPRPQVLGTRFPQFLFDEVMPLVDSSFRTKTGAEFTGLAGASYGGAVVLYTAFVHPHRIGYLLVKSPALQIGDGRLMEDAREATGWPLALYLGVGTEEGETPETSSIVTQNVRAMHDTLSKRPGTIRLHLWVQDGATHWYDAWRARLPGALTFLLGDRRSRWEGS